MLTHSLVTLKNMFPEELQTIAVDLDGTPGMELHQIGEVLFPLRRGQLIGAAIKTLRDPVHGSGMAASMVF